MKDIFKKIVRTMDLREYAAEMETEICVWVNPPRGLLLENDALVGMAQVIREELDEVAELVRAQEPDEALKKRSAGLVEKLSGIGKAQMAILAQLWSQGDDPESHWSVEEIGQLVERGMDTDPALWMWMRQRTFRMIADYRAGQKKV